MQEIKQEVNLFTPELRPQKGPSALTYLLLGLALLVCLMATATLYIEHRIQEWEQRLEATQAEQNELRAEVEELRQEATEGPDEPLRERIRELSARRDAKSGLVDLLSQRETELQEGFAPYLEAMARQRVSDLWITSFRIDLEERPELRISGRTTVSEQIPHYLQRLSREEVMSGLTFEQLRARQVEQEEELLSFTLYSRAE